MNSTKFSHAGTDLFFKKKKKQNMSIKFCKDFISEWRNSVVESEEKALIKNKIVQNKHDSFKNILKKEF